MRALLLRILTFRGRADRREYWLFAIPITVVIWGGLWLFMAVEGDLAAQAFFLLAVVPAASFANIALGTRRLHDRGRSGWWLLLYCGVPTGTMVVLGMHTGDASNWFAVPLAGPLAVALVDLGLLPGAPGRNRYNDDDAALDASIFD